MRRPVLILSALAYALLLAGCGDKSTPAEGKEGGEAGEHAEGEKHAEGEADHAEGEGEAGGHADEVPSTTMPAQRAAANGIRTERVGPGTIADQHEVQGLLTPVEGSIAKVQARFPGPIRSLRANVGDTVLLRRNDGQVAPGHLRQEVQPLGLSLDRQRVDPRLHQRAARVELAAALEHGCERKGQIRARQAARFAGPEHILGGCADHERRPEARAVEFGIQYVALTAGQSQIRVCLLDAREGIVEGQTVGSGCGEAEQHRCDARGRSRESRSHGETPGKMRRTAVRRADGRVRQPAMGGRNGETRAPSPGAVTSGRTASEVRGITAGRNSPSGMATDSWAQQCAK